LTRLGNCIGKALIPLGSEDSQDAISPLLGDLTRLQSARPGQSMANSTPAHHASHVLPFVGSHTDERQGTIHSKAVPTTNFNRESGGRSSCLSGLIGHSQASRRLMRGLDVRCGLRSSTQTGSDQSASEPLTGWGLTPWCANASFVSLVCFLRPSSPEHSSFQLLWAAVGAVPEQRCLCRAGAVEVERLGLAPLIVVDLCLSAICRGLAYRGGIRLLRQLLPRLRVTCLNQHRRASPMNASV
jgi:hypothetical protein